MKKGVKNTICLSLMLILFYATTASAANGEDSINVPFTLITLLAIVLLLITCELYIENARLKRRILEYRTKLMEYTKYEPIRMGGALGEQKNIEETFAENAGLEDRHAKRLYWDRFSETLNKTQSGGELTELQSRKKDLEDMVELTKRKYHRREIDEKSFSEIIKDQQKQIIEVESRIRKLTKEEVK